MNGPSALMSPSTVRQRLAARIAAHGEGLVEAAQIHGVGAQPNALADRAFVVVLLDVPEGSLREESGGAMDVRRNFRVDLQHRAKPHDGAGVWDQAVDDEVRVRRALLVSREDGLRPVEHRIVFDGSEPPTIEGSGAYRRVSLLFHVAYIEALE